MKKSLLLIVILAAAFALSACGGTKPVASTAPIATVPAEFAGKTNPLGADAAAAGADVFKSYCSSCHGEGGRGDGVAGSSLTPPPANLVEFAPKVGDDYLFWRVSQGKEGTAMVAWGGVLTEEQIWQVVAFVRTLK